MVVDFDILTIIVGIIIFLLICMFINLKYNKEKIYYVFLTIMFCYLMCVVKLTLFPILLFEGMPSNIQASINYIPFQNGIGRTEIYNLIMTIPLGIGTPFITKMRGIKRMGALGLATGCIIETLQYLEALWAGGFTLRVIDINDIIFNLMGVIVGYVLLILFSRIFVRYKDNEYNSFWQYVYEVCMTIHF